MKPGTVQCRSTRAIAVHREFAVLNSYARRLSSPVAGMLDGGTHTRSTAAPVISVAAG